MEIVCRGNIIKTTEGITKADICFSDIFSFLIKETGKKVEHYASDLYWDLKTIENAINKDNPTDAEFMIGLREMGVDGTDFIKARKKNPEIYGTPYINIYIVKIKINELEREITITLSEEE